MPLINKKRILLKFFNIKTLNARISFRWKFFSILMFIIGTFLFQLSATRIPQKRMNDPAKNTPLFDEPFQKFYNRFSYYFPHIVNLAIPNIFFQKNLQQNLEKIQNYNKEYMLKRLNYYNKLSKPFDISRLSSTIQLFHNQHKSLYFFDMYEYLKYFNPYFKVSYLFGDITHIPSIPTIVKSRPIEGSNENSILLKLDKLRHFNFVQDTTKFEQKKNMLVWRGAAHQPHRKEFVSKFYNHPLCDVGATNTLTKNVLWQKKELSIREQLTYKFIFCIEGNDVATSLKWSMSSNSLVFMQKPKYETWFMEGTLIPNHHYVLIKNDFSDLEEKILYYTTHTEEALKIIQNAQEYTKQFCDSEQEDLLSFMVLEKYFKLGNIS